MSAQEHPASCIAACLIWIEATGEPLDHWLSQTLQSLSQSGVRFHDTELPALSAGQAVHLIPLTQLDHSLQSLRRIARFTDRIWPLPAAARPRSAHAAAIRGLGAPQEDARHGHRRVQLHSLRQCK